MFTGVQLRVNFGDNDHNRTDLRVRRLHLGLVTIGIFTEADPACKSRALFSQPIDNSMRSAPKLGAGVRDPVGPTRIFYLPRDQALSY
jgi:hypothetical protein